MTRALTLSDLAQALNVPFEGAGDVMITSVATLSEAQSGQLSFLANPAYKPQLASCQASAVIVAPQDASECPTSKLISNNPYATWATALQLLHPSPMAKPGIHTSAVIDSSAQIDGSASIGPHCVIGPNCTIGPHVSLGSHCVLEHGVSIGAHSRLVAQIFIGAQCQLGERVLVHPGVVIGADGFGIAMDQGQWHKVPQLGRVVVGNDSEIGANTTIDRGALGDTVLAEDVRIDNQVQIAHNVCIGAHTAIAGCVGIAGSTTIGAYCMIAGASGIGGHITIADHVVITAMSTVISSIDTPGMYGSGIPVQPHQRWKRILVRLSKLDDWINRIKNIEKGSSSP